VKGKSSLLATNGVISTLVCHKKESSSQDILKKDHQIQESLTRKHLAFSKLGIYSSDPLTAGVLKILTFKMSIERA
jgi:hypothetical protein